MCFASRDVLTAGRALLGLTGCGGSASEPHAGAPENAGGSPQIGGGGAADGGRANGLGGNPGESGAEPQGGRAGAQGLGGSSAPAGAGGTGAAGEAAVDPALAHLPLPAGCKPLSGAETNLLCTLHTTCGATTGQNSCYHTASGQWQCSCEAPNADRTYLLDGAIGLNACAVAAGLCSAPAPALDPESCVATHETVGSVGIKTCALDLNCQTPAPVDFAPGVGATLYGGGSVKCTEVPAQNPEPGPLRVDCEANGKTGSKQYTLVANDIANACRPVLKSFLTASQPQFEGYESCVREVPSASPDDCHVTETCFDSAPLAAGVNLVKNPLNRDVFCGFDDLGALTCGCTWETATDGGAVHKDVFSASLGPAAKPASCDFSRCPLDVHAVPTGPGDCPSGETMDAGDTCRGFFSCSRPATLNGQPVTVYSQLDTLCAQAADQSIYCGCAVGDETTSFRLNDGTSMAGACTLERNGCLQHVALPVGRASYASLPDNPLPTP